MQDLDKILKQFEKIVSPNFCNDLARQTKFIKRSTSRIKGHEFAQAMMIPNGFLEMETLNSLSVRMRKINQECDLSASALAQRINSKAAELFMKACFETLLKEILKTNITCLSDLKNLSKFNRMLIEDSTKSELHEKLSPHFKGSGGMASKASVKIDYIFDYLSEKFVFIEFVSGNIPDQNLADRIITVLEKNDLVIRDLGYYVLERIKEIERKNAYYISRLKINVDVYESKESKKPLDLARFLDNQNSQDIVDKIVFIGKEKHQVRLVACLMSEEAINKRRRNVNRTAQRKGTKISKKKARLLKYCFFITNVPIEMLSSIEIMATYRGRWRVELIFKQWKSCLKLHIFKGYNKERLHCFLYGRLIMILLLGSFSAVLMRFADSLGKELSCYKLTNYLIADHAFPQAFLDGKMHQFIDQLLKDIPRRICLDKRKRLSLRKNVKLGNSYFNEFLGQHTNVA